MSAIRLHSASKSAIVVFSIVALALAAVIGAVGLRWRAGVACKNIEVRGTHWADAADVEALATADLDSMLYRIDPHVVADRVARHPWIRSVDVTRIPTGTLKVEVAERAPVALVLQSDRPVYYLDRDGFRMPLVEGRVADIPIVRGLTEEYAPLLPIEHEVLREFALVMGDLDTADNAIVSEIFVGRDGLSVGTTPLPGLAPIRVNLGDRDLAYRFRLLAAFWSQVVLAPEPPDVRTIDLRYNGQIITT